MINKIFFGLLINYIDFIKKKINILENSGYKIEIN